MEKDLKLPIGIEDFREIRQLGFYYIDKTKLIEQLIENWGKVNLFTRPRRFGKTLNMSMLKYFFEIGTDKELFDGLYIAEKKELSDAYMGKYPVIFLSMKNVDGLTFEAAKYRLIELIGGEIEHFKFLSNSKMLSENEKERYHAIIALKDGKYAMEEEQLISSIQILSQLLYRHYGQKVVILIDEYDVPLDKAFQNGYYREMVALIRGLFGQALKTNDFLQFAVLTGCLRVSKESIFTGLNNFKILSISDVRFDEQFGFTDAEVRQLLEDYRMSSHFVEVKEWYDGYHFGNTDVYCPWDVINYLDLLRADPEARPQTFWINSSGNDLVKRFIHMADETTKDEIERLIAGEAIEKSMRLDLTYDEIDSSIENIWSVLFTTGYLTKVGEVEQLDGDGTAYRLVIPNKEVRAVFVLQIKEWFSQNIVNDKTVADGLYDAFSQGNAPEIQRQLTDILGQTISVLDTKARDGQKENFYHGIMIGLLRGYRNWVVKSNVESGDGFADIVIKPRDPDAGIVIELKYSPEFRGMEAACKKAMEQIKDRRYDEILREEGREKILAYGIAFCKKRCQVICEKL